MSREESGTSSSLDSSDPPTRALDEEGVFSGDGEGDGDSSTSRSRATPSPDSLTTSSSESAMQNSGTAESLPHNDTKGKEFVGKEVTTPPNPNPHPPPGEKVQRGINPKTKIIRKVTEVSDNSADAHNQASLSSSSSAPQIPTDSGDPAKRTQRKISTDAGSENEDEKEDNKKTDMNVLCQNKTPRALLKRAVKGGPGSKCYDLEEIPEVSVPLPLPVKRPRGRPPKKRKVEVKKTSRRKRPRVTQTTTRKRLSRKVKGKGVNHYSPPTDDYTNINDDRDSEYETENYDEEEDEEEEEFQPEPAPRSRARGSPQRGRGKANGLTNKKRCKPRRTRRTEVQQKTASEENHPKIIDMDIDMDEPLSSVFQQKRSVQTKKQDEEEEEECEILSSNTEKPITTRRRHKMETKHKTENVGNLKDIATCKETQTCEEDLDGKEQELPSLSHPHGETETEAETTSKEQGPQQDLLKQSSYVSVSEVEAEGSEEHEGANKTIDTEQDMTKHATDDESILSPPNRKMSSLSPPVRPRQVKSLGRMKMDQLQHPSSETEENNVAPRSRSRDSRSESIASATSNDNANRPRSRVRSRSHSCSLFLQPHERSQDNWRTDFLLELLRKVRRKTDPYGFFSKPVNPDEDECPDYYNVVDVNEAMCFDVMQDMIIAGGGRSNPQPTPSLPKSSAQSSILASTQSKTVGSIRTIDEFVACLNMIIKCARDYNTDTENFVRIQADLIEPKSEEYITAARKKWEEEKEKRVHVDNVETDVKAKESTVVKDRGRNSRGSPLKTRSSSIARTDGIREGGDDVRCSPDKKRQHRRNTRRQSRSQTRSVREATKRNKKKSEVNNRPSRKTKKQKVKYDLDDDSLESSPDDLLPQDGNDSDLEGNGPIIGMEIPFCKPTFADSIITECNKREDWLDLCPQLATVCNEAARRSTLRACPGAKRYEKPLSETYIKERLDYDSPLDGFYVKTKAEPHHLQGFIVTTSFATWRKTFQWTMEAPAAIVTPTDHRLHLTDLDGSLTKDLQEAKRENIISGSEQGLKFPRICEISLVGGLGCGSKLLARALSKLREAQKYDFVVLQSTKIAIPFYEKHGFVRVGALMRFKDIEALPEVAYRHWSDIVNGEAVEPSYMMARRLNTPITSMPRSIKKNEISVKERTEEIISALKSAYFLLEEALTIRTGKSAPYRNSFRELLSAAREFAISADDFQLVKLIDESKSEFSGTHFGQSKILLRKELKNGRISVGDNDAGFVCAESDITVTEVNVQVTFDGSNHLDDLLAVVPKEILSYENATSVKIVLSEKEDSEDEELEDEEHEDEDLEDEDHEEHEDEKWKENIDLLAYLPAAAKSSADIIEASDLAVENLMSFICKGSSMKKSKERTSQNQILIGDDIMVKVDALDGSPLWVDATVTKSCKITTNVPHYNGNNGFLVEWEENENIRKQRRVLDTRNRGVGKQWCTLLDSASFAVLPLNILDSMLIGSQVNYPDTNGQTIVGIVTERIGQGLYDDPKWKVERVKNPKKNAKSVVEDVPCPCKFLTASALKEAIHFTDKCITRVKKLLKEGAKLRKLLEKRVPRVEETKRIKKTFCQSADGWARYRLDEFSLLQISEDEKKKRKKSINMLDDAIIHLSTGVSSVGNSNDVVRVQRTSSGGDDQNTNPVADEFIGKKRKISELSIDKTSSSKEKAGEKKNIRVPSMKRLRSSSQDKGGSLVRRSSRNRIVEHAPKVKIPSI